MDTTSRTDVGGFLERCAEALAARCALPAPVVGDGGTIPVAGAAEVEAAFAGAADAYRAQGLVGIRPDLGAVEPLTPNLTLVDVGWACLDGAGQARQHTTCRYLLRRSNGGELGIQVVVDTTAQR